VHDPLVPQLGEVLDREPRAGGLVDEDRVDVRAAQLAADHDRGRRARGGQHVPRAHPGGHEDDAVGPVLEQAVEHGTLAPGAAPAGDEQDAVAELGGERLQPVGDLREEGVVQVVEQHADRPRAPAGQAARHRVGPVAEPFRRVEHALAPVRAHLRALAHDERDERPRDAGRQGDVLHGGRLRGRAVAAAPHRCGLRTDTLDSHGERKHTPRRLERANFLERSNGMR
jgi:hypothetical protein